MTRTELMTTVVIPRLEADTTLTTTLGGAHIYLAESSMPVRFPSISWTVVNERLLENYWRVEVQFDFWANTATQADTIRSRLRIQLHNDRRRILGSIDMSSLYIEGRMLAYKPPVSDYSREEPQPGVIHEMQRYRFDLARPRYTT